MKEPTKFELRLGERLKDWEFQAECLKLCLSAALCHMAGITHVSSELETMEKLKKLSLVSGVSFQHLRLILNDDANPDLETLCRLSAATGYQWNLKVHKLQRMTAPAVEPPATEQSGNSGQPVT